MASCVLSGEYGNSATLYAETVTSVDAAHSRYLKVGEGSTAQNAVIVTQENIVEDAVSKLVGSVTSGVVRTDALFVRPLAFAAASVGTGTLTGGTENIATDASSATALIFVSARTAAGSLGVTAQNETGFTVTSSDGTDTGTFIWWIVNPSYTT